MRSRAPVITCLLALLLAGCPKQGRFLAPTGLLEGLTAGAPTILPSPDPQASPGPSPKPSATPTPLVTPTPVPLNALSLTVQPLNLRESGASSFPIEAREAILVLTRASETVPAFSFAFTGAAGLGSARTRLMKAPTVPRPICGTFAHDLDAPAFLPPSREVRRLQASLPPPALGATRSILVQSLRRTVECRYLGTEGVIWVDLEDRDVFASQELAELGQRFDQEAYPRVTAIYGPGPKGGSDGYNGGDDRVNFVLSRQVPPTYSGFMEPLDYFSDDDAQRWWQRRSNHGKYLYLSPRADTASLLDTMIHEYVHLVFMANRLVTYSQTAGYGLPLGRDASYFKVDLSERWLNEGLAVLAEYLVGRGYDGPYRPFFEAYLSQPERFDMADFYRVKNEANEDMGNYGGAFLFMAYANERDRTFPKAVQTARGVSTEAVTEVLQPSTRKAFPDLYRDFGLALLMDDLHGDVPPRYHVPFLDLTSAYGGTQAQSMTSGTEPPLTNGVRFVRVAFPTGKGSLTIYNPAGMRATLLLYKPAARAEVFSD